MLIGMLAALSAAVLYAIGSVLQAIAAANTENEGSLDPRLLVRMIKQWQYLLGLAADGAGFILGLVAIQYLPLFLAEAVLAASVGFTALLAVQFLQVKLNRLEVSALVAMMIGLILLAFSARPEQPRALPTDGKLLLLVGAVLVILMAVLAAKFGGARTGVALAAVSGLAFSGMGIAARTFVVPDRPLELLTDPTLYAVIIFGATGLFLFASALQRARVTTVTAMVFGLETVVPAVVGLVFLGDEVRPGREVVAAIGFVLALGSALVLAGQAEPSVATHAPVEA